MIEQHNWLNKDNFSWVDWGSSVDYIITLENRGLESHGYKQAKQ